MLNIVALVGRLGKDPELKTTPSGVSVCSFSLAVDRSYSKNGSRETDWIDCVAWRNTAEFLCKYFTKGQMMAVEGSLQTRSWQDRNGGNRTKMEVIVGNAHFCGSRERVTVGTQNAPEPSQAEGDLFDLMDGDETLPF